MVTLTLKHADMAKAYLPDGPRSCPPHRGMPTVNNGNTSYDLQWIGSRTLLLTCTMYTRVHAIIFERDCLKQWSYMYNQECIINREIIPLV